MQKFLRITLLATAVPAQVPGPDKASFAQVQAPSASPRQAVLPNSSGRVFLAQVPRNQPAHLFHKQNWCKRRRALLPFSKAAQHLLGAQSGWEQVHLPSLPHWFLLRQAVLFDRRWHQRSGVLRRTVTLQWERLLHSSPLQALHQYPLGESPERGVPPRWKPSVRIFRLLCRREIRQSQRRNGPNCEPRCCAKVCQGSWGDLLVEFISTLCAQNLRPVDVVLVMT